MKNKIIFPITLLCALACCFALFACTPNAGDNVSVYTVRFHDNYSGVVAKVEVDEEGKFTLPAEPTRLGYSFVGWYTSSDEQTTPFTAASQVSGDITVFAKWERDTSVHLVTYKYRNYTTADGIATVNAGGKLTAPAAPKYDSDDTFSFDGWFTDEACTAEYDFDAAVNADLTLYAGWTRVKVAVRFDANYPGAAALPSQVVTIGGVATRPADPTRARFEFNNWYTARVGGTLYDFDSAVNEALTLYAHWAKNEYTVTFDLNGGTAQGAELAYLVKKTENLADIASAIEAKLAFEGHEFDGWYTVKTDPDSEIDETTPAERVDVNANVSDDMRIYAKWALKEYEVTFDYNYDGAPEAPAKQTVKYGKTIYEPSVTTRKDYMFIGWFTDAAGTAENQFTLDMPVTGNIKLYAKWFEIPDTEVYVNVKFVYVLDTDVEYQTVRVVLGNSVEAQMPADPAVNGYYFGGWYTSKAFTARFNNKANLVEDTTVYGKMLKQYTLEAEAVSFEGKKGQGTSTNSDEEGMIYGAAFVEGGDVSNGYFVREMYYNGAFLLFEVYADEEVNDAVLSLRVSSECYEFTTTKEKDGKKYNYLSSDEFKIYINPVFNAEGIDKTQSYNLDYDGLYMPMANLEEKEDLSYNKTPFEECFIADRIHLNAGLNNIVLWVDNNNNHGGTFHAEAPTIDCMYIYSSTNVEMEDYEYYTRPGVRGQA